MKCTRVTRTMSVGIHDPWFHHNAPKYRFIEGISNTAARNTMPQLLTAVSPASQPRSPCRAFQGARRWMPAVPSWRGPRAQSQGPLGIHFLTSLPWTVTVRRPDTEEAPDQQRV